MVTAVAHPGVVPYCELVAAPGEAEAAADEALARFRVARSSAPEDEHEALLLRILRRAAAGRAAPPEGRRGLLRRGPSRTCRSVPALLAARANGELERDDLLRLERHLGGCDACRAAEGRFAAAEEAFATAPAVAPAPRPEPELGPGGVQEPAGTPLPATMTARRFAPTGAAVAARPRRRRPASRVLVPLALLVVGAATAALVAGGASDDDGEARRSAASPTAPGGRAVSVRIQAPERPTTTPLAARRPGERRRGPAAVVPVAPTPPPAPAAPATPVPAPTAPPPAAAPEPEAESEADLGAPADLEAPVDEAPPVAPLQPSPAVPDAPVDAGPLAP